MSLGEAAAKSAAESSQGRERPPPREAVALPGGIGPHVYFFSRSCGSRTRRPAGQKTAYPEVRSQDGAMSNSSFRTSDVSSYVNAGMSIRPSDDHLVI